MLPGDHFFINTETAALLRSVGEQLDELVRARGHDVHSSRQWRLASNRLNHQ